MLWSHLGDKNINNQIFYPLSFPPIMKSEKKISNTNNLIQNTILIRYKTYNSAVLAQLVEHSAVNRAVTGPSPVDGVPTPFFSCRTLFYVKSDSNLKSNLAGYL